MFSLLIVMGIDGECEYMYRMQNTVDHTNVEELAGLVGVECNPSGKEEETKQTCGESCAVIVK
jgi:hypothetical protein